MGGWQQPPLPRAHAAWGQGPGDAAWRAGPEELNEAGATWLVVEIPHDDIDRAVETVHRYGRHVLPQIR